MSHLDVEIERDMVKQTEKLKAAKGSTIVETNGIEYIVTNAGRIPRDILEIISSLARSIFQTKDPSAAQVAQLARQMLRKDNITTEDIMSLSEAPPWKRAVTKISAAPKKEMVGPSVAYAYLNDELDDPTYTAMLEEQDKRIHHKVLGYAPDEMEGINNIN